MSLKSDVVCQSYGNVYSVIVFSWTRCIYIYILFFWTPYWPRHGCKQIFCNHC